MKKVLFINHSSNIYGAESVMLYLLEKAFRDESKKDVYVIEPATQKKSLFKREIDNLGIQNHYFLPYKNLGVSFLRSILVILYNIYTVIRLFLIVKKKQIDIIYSNTSITCVGIIVAMLTGKEHIWHFHEPIEEAHGWVQSLSIFYKIFLSYKRNLVVFVSNTQRQQWLNQLPGSFKKSMVIYNPIKEIVTREDSASLNKNIVFGYMGGWTVRKNIPFLLKVFAKFNFKYPNTKLLLAKNIGDEKDKIVKLIKELNLSDCVKSNKVYNSISDFYGDIHIFVLPSLSETWGLVVLEAMSVSKPVILTQNTGLHEVLENGVDCIFINPLSETDLYQAMEKLLDVKFREQLAINAYQKIKQMDFNNQFVEKFEKLLKNND